MRFRTEIELQRAAPITHRQRVMMLGSCFTDNIGAELLKDGFDVAVNPLGALYNPASIARLLERAVAHRPYAKDDLVCNNGVWHALDFESRRQGTDPDALLEALNLDFFNFCEAYEKAEILIVTFGTAYVFTHAGTGEIVGNCHKLPAREFARHRLAVDDIVRQWTPPADGKRVIFTVSPVRHLADGLHGNQLSKATLLLAVDRLTEGGAEYFPAYEIVNDDLRDYRFYADDLRHPSAQAVAYIYEKFADTYFTADTRDECRRHRDAWRRAQHRTIVK